MVLDDVESYANAQSRLDYCAEAEEMRRGEEVGVSLAERLCGMKNEYVNLEVRGGRRLEIRILDCSQYWLHGENRHNELVISLPSIIAVSDTAGVTRGYAHGINAKISLAGTVRRMADKYGELNIYYEDKCVRGRIWRVGKDYIDLVRAGKCSAYSLAHIACIEGVGLGQWS